MQLNKVVLLVTFVGILLFGSCRKDKTQEIGEDQTPSVELVTTPGSWWKYQWYTIDSVGNATLKPEKDCLYVAGDTLIANQLYTHYKGDYYVYEDFNWYWRDSMGFLVNQNGMILLSPEQMLDSVGYTPGNQYDIYTISNGIASNYQVPEGSFEVIESQLHYHNTDQSPFTNCEDVWINSTRFSRGNGVISFQTGLISQVQNQCSFDESRLTDYYIAPE